MLYLITMDLFDEITLGKRYQSRIGWKVQLDEIPLKPHGHVSVIQPRTLKAFGIISLLGLVCRHHVGRYSI
jgi:hypothetical protein